MYPQVFRFPAPALINMRDPVFKGCIMRVEEQTVDTWNLEFSLRPTLITL